MDNTQHYHLEILGYFRDEIRGRFPELAGIYFVYSGYYNPINKWVTLKRLLYIGETDNLYQRHNEHDKRVDFIKQLSEDEKLFYSFALTEYSEKERKRIESALIYELLPPLNEKSTTTFNYQPTKVEIGGDRHAYIPDIISAP